MLHAPRALHGVAEGRRAATGVVTEERVRGARRVRGLRREEVVEQHEAALAQRAQRRGGLGVAEGAGRKLRRGQQRLRGVAERGAAAARLAERAGRARVDLAGPGARVVPEREALRGVVYGAINLRWTLALATAGTGSAGGAAGARVAAPAPPPPPCAEPMLSALPALCWSICSSSAAIGLPARSLERQKRRKPALWPCPCPLAPAMDL